MLHPNATIAKDPKVVYRHLQEGGVLLHLGSGQYYGLNQTGYLIWSLIEEGMSVAALLARLHEHFQNTPGLEDDMRNFLDGLRHRGLIQVVSGTAGNPEVVHDR